MQSVSVLFLVLLSFEIFWSLFSPFISSDKTRIWTPTTIISLVLIYYVIIPSIIGLTDYEAAKVPRQSYFYIAAFLFFTCVLFAFSYPIKIRFHFLKRWNKMLNQNNVHKFAIILFVVAFACYIPFKGFRYSISADDAVKTVEREGFVSYFIDLISLLVASSSLVFFSIRGVNKNKKKLLIFLVILYFTLIVFIVGGFRFRIVLLILSMATVYHLYPEPRKINFKILMPVAVVVYLGFAIMDIARVYGTGIDLDAAGDISLDQASKGAHENVDVCCYSIRIVNDYSENVDFEYFDPFITAVLMPIPRALFPSKPGGEYLLKNEVRIVGRAGVGAVVLSFVEGFMSFGWLGVILYGLLFGLASRVVWRNYKTSGSIGSILLLALFNGFTFQWMSRGYMASAFNDFMYFVILPFWIIQIFSFKIR